MLYYILRPLIHWFLRAWFRNIVIVGKVNLELEGPIIYVSNHPNAALDPLLLATHQKPKLYYLAAAEWFGKGFKNYVFREHFNMIPIGRPWLKLGEEISNQDVFEQCYHALAEGKRIVIYPEGSSVTVTNIREVKTGAARIKLGGDAFLKKTNARWQDVKIIPLGLNYYHPRRFQSDVVMHLGDPIDFSDIDETDEKERVRLMMERIRTKMAELVFHFEKEDFRRVAKDVYLIYGGHLLEQMNLSKD
ncbi:MAG: 1-acyl-sn-glycerol-3-phosphate acyltransferase, partial [Cryomorphaceae bacterium]